MGAAIDLRRSRRSGTGLRGDAYVPGDEGYDEGRQAFNLNAHQEPALVVVAEATEDIVAAVRLAKEQGLGVGVLATGHGVANPCDGGVLVNTSLMRGVQRRSRIAGRQGRAGGPMVRRYLQRPRRMG